eukprot:GHRR01016406.1.p2 GENE.GHRR01016406.1~~GHRR01016406.1.p2  ORF type:complete len:167 (+),score=45.61 GHRR01016406.1:929-1429(+)
MGSSSTSCSCGCSRHCLQLSVSTVSHTQFLSAYCSSKPCNNSLCSIHPSQFTLCNVYCILLCAQRVADLWACHSCRLLVVVCENKVLLNDLNTRKSFEVQRAVLDNKSPTCVTFLFRGGHNAPGGQPDADNLMTSPVLAIGCSDGSVRLLHLATLRVSAAKQLCCT